MRFNNKIKTVFKIYSSLWVGGAATYSTYIINNNIKNIYFCKDEYTHKEYMYEYFGKSITLTGGFLLGGFIGMITLPMPQIAVLYCVNDTQVKTILDNIKKTNIIQELIGSPK